MNDYQKFNPKRDYVSENIVIIIGAFFVWALKGFKGSINTELTKNKKIRNVFVVLFFWIAAILMLLYYFTS